MGQAKNRGPLAARIEAAAQLKDQRIEYRCANCSAFPKALPSAAIWSRSIAPTSFFGAINDDGAYAFVGAPESAVRFAAFDDARKLARAEQGEVVVALFDFAAKVIVVNVPDEPATN